VDGAREISTIQSSIQKASDRVIQIRKQFQRVGTSDFSQDPFDGEAVAPFISKLETDLKKLNERKANADAKVTKAKESMSALKALVIEIKSLGKQYLTHSSDGKCPLCESLLDRTKLEQNIDQINFSEDLLPDLLKEKSDADSLFEKAQGELTKVNKLVEVARFYNPELDANSATVGQIKVECQQLNSVLVDITSLQSEQQEHLAVLSSQGFSIREYTDLCRDLKIVPENRPSLELIASLAEQLNSSDETKLSLVKEVGDLDTNIQSAVSQFKISNPQFENANSHQELKTQVSKVIGDANSFHFSLLNLKEAFPGIGAASPLRQTQTLVKNTATEVSEQLSFLSGKKQKSLAVDQMNAQIVEKEAAESTKRASHQQADRAVRALKKINDEYGRDQAVKKFFDQNKPIIVEIFKAIHAPNEFDDIILETENVFVSKDGVRRELSKISTGQRTAVALSVFFGLHLSCPQAPRVILFDDPVAFVDDLNVLAFLDFLRELTLTGNRQIFFATANKKLASLMRRKFEESGIGFCTIDPLK